MIPNLIITPPDRVQMRTDKVSKDSIKSKYIELMNKGQNCKQNTVERRVERIDAMLPFLVSVHPLTFD